MKKILLPLLCFVLLSTACLRANADATWKPSGPTMVKHNVIEVTAVASVERSCDVARDAWNDAIGFALFESSPSVALADVLIEDAPNRDVGDGDSGYLAATGQRLLNVDGSDSGLAPYLCAHELGHLLGLAHDADPSSIMHHFMPQGSGLMSGDSGADAVMVLPKIRVSGEDAAAVRRAYGHSPNIS